jgi:acyl-CoA thioesterase FadM
MPDGRRKQPLSHARRVKEVNETMIAEAIANEPTRATHVRLRPRFEGCNIGAWLGYKHLMYLMEEAVIEHFRSMGFGPQRLFQELQLALEIVDSSIRIVHVVHVDDVVRLEVTPRLDVNGAPLFDVQAFLDGQDAGAASKHLKLFSGKVRTALVPEPGNARGEWPPALAPYVVPPRERTPTWLASPPQSGDGRGGLDAAEDLIARIAVRNAFIWKWRIPYFYCHYSDRLQHSGYIRLQEEVVDLFLAHRGLSIRTMLARHGWIPFVQNARIEILEDALMEETIHTVYTVTDVYKSLLYVARFDCYMQREGALVHTARGEITHGYAQIRSRSDWGLVPFDEETTNALNGGSDR